MASNSIPPPSLEGFKEDHLHCIICSEEYKEPKTLPCQHTFCKDCLQSYILSSKSFKENRVLGYKCPICRKFVRGTQSKAKWAANVPTDFRIKSMLESLQLLQESSSFQNADAVSEYCLAHSKPAANLCKTHSCLVCQDCTSGFNLHSECDIIPSSKVFTDAQRLIKNVQSIIERLEAIMLAIQNPDYLETDRTKIRFEVVTMFRRNKRCSNIKHRDVLQFIDRMFTNHAESLPALYKDCKATVEDAKEQISVVKQQTTAPVETLIVTTDVFSDFHDGLKKQLNDLEVKTCRGNINARVREYLKSVLNVMCNFVNINEAELEARDFPAQNFLKLLKSDSFNANVDTDEKNCCITGAVILADGRIILADSSNSKIKLFSESLHFVSERLLLSPPFDVTETEGSRIVITFGERSIMQVYTVASNTLPSDHESIRTEQPCYGISAGSGVVFTFCKNTFLKPACIKVYDYQFQLMYKIGVDLFFTGEYLDFCPVTNRLYVVCRFLGNKYLTCFTDDGEEVWRRRIPSFDPHGVLAVPTGVLVTLRPAFLQFNDCQKSPEVVWTDAARSQKVFPETWCESLACFPSVGFAKNIASNKQRTKMLVLQETPLINFRKNNEVLVFKFS